MAFKRNLIDEYVVTDILVIPEDKDVPDEYAGCYLTKDTSLNSLLSFYITDIKCQNIYS